MRIEAYSQIQQLYNASKPTANKSVSNGAAFRDKLQISSAGRDMQVAKAAVANSPDVREDKVAALKRELANGTYNVSGEDFAEKMIEKYAQTLA